MRPDLFESSFGQVGDALRADDRAQDLVDEHVGWRVQLQGFEFRVLLYRLVQHFVEKGIRSFRGVAQRQDNQRKFAGAAAGPLGPGIDAGKEVADRTIEVVDELGSGRRHHLEALWKTLNQADKPLVWLVRIET